MVERTVGLVAAQVRVSDRKQPPGLLGDRGEYLLRRRPARHERRDAAQRGLLLGEAGPGPSAPVVFAIAVATSSVKEASRASVSAGSGCSSWPLNATTMQPHSRLSALTGTPTEERSPQSREATWPITPETSL